MIVEIDDDIQKIEIDIDETVLIKIDMIDLMLDDDDDDENIDEIDEDEIN